MGRWAILGSAATLALWVTTARAQDFGGFYNDPGPPPAATAGAPTPAPAVEPVVPEPEPPFRRFGAPGTVVLTTSAGAGVSGTLYTNSRAWGAGFSLAPELDVFVLRNFAIGLSSSFGTSVARGYGADGSLIEARSSFVYVGPRFGVALPLGDRVTFFPTVAFGLEWRRRELEIVEGTTLSVPSPIASPETTQTGFWLELFTPLLFHPRSHVLVGAGPSFFHEFARATGGPDVGGERTTVGGSMVVGGTWGSDVPSTPWPHFADRNHLLISTEIGASWTGYAGTDSSTASVDGTLGADYVVGQRITVGGFIGGGYGFVRGSDPVTRSSVTRTVGRGNGGLRIGYDLRLTSGVSLFPTLGLGIDYGTFELREGTQRNDYRAASFALTARIPLVVHVVPHLSLGLGPYLRRDLARIVEPYPSRPNVLETTFGLSTYVFVWL
jgi:hypothetical protein